MTDHKTSAPPTNCCQHSPNRVLRKPDLARELGVCDRTIDNLLDEGNLPQPCWLNSIPVWMLYDVHDYISAASKTNTSACKKESSEKSAASKDAKKDKRPAHKAGKFSV
jgi:predicted DNA-binding transcriptional regulator AlpA